MKLGSFDFLEKPVDEFLLLETIRSALENEKLHRNSGLEADAAFKSVSQLSEKEKRVASLLARGLSKKEIGENYGISVKTVDAHTQAIYKKLNVHNTAELARLLQVSDLSLLKKVH
jgi:FixJ family two-component response regulator